MIISRPNPGPCQAAQLERLQRDELSDEQALALAHHLEQCPDCQQTLDQTVELDTAWNQARSTVIDRIRDHAATPQQEANLDCTAVASAYLAWLRPYEPPEEGKTFLGILDGYPIVRVLGTGGMGIVLEGWDRELHRPVAIKVMHMHLAAIGVAKQRFVREARCAASIVHTNVVAIHRIHADHMPPYFVMPLIAGESLQERLQREGTIPVDQAMRIIAQVADGLSAAEKQGLIHRDVKPANILVERGTDRALLTDFGLVRALDEATITHSGAIAGTPQYMSPEQASGASLDVRTDIYSLGAVLYAMLTGHPPFSDPSPLALVKKIAEANPKPVSYYDPTLPKSVVVFLDWLMQKDRRQRPARAADVARIAMEIHANLVNPMQYVLPTRIRAMISRERWKAWTTPAIASLVAVLAVALWWFVPRDAQHARTETEANSTNMDASNSRSNFSTPDTFTPSTPNASWIDPDSELRFLDDHLLRLEQSVYDEMKSLTRDAIDPSVTTISKEPL